MRHADSTTNPTRGMRRERTAMSLITKTKEISFGRDNMKKEKIKKKEERRSIV
jgi:hypothetical protein